MMVRKEMLFVLCCFFVIAVALIMPAYADVKSLKTDKTFYKKGDKIIFSGTAEDKDVGEFVTVVVEDSASNFVTLRQGFITVDKDFEVTIDTKEKFVSHGVYNATGFVENKTNSKWVAFDFSLDGSPVIHQTQQPAPVQQPTQQEPSQTQQPSPTPQPNDEVESETDSEDTTIQEKIKERIEAAKKEREAQTTTPPQTGADETAVNQTTTGDSTTATDDTKGSGNEPATSGVSSAIDLGSKLLYVVIGLVGAGAVAGVVYGIKNKNRHNRDDKPVVKIREPSERSSIPSEDDYALMILKNRLAKGEITIDEYNALKEALREP